MITLSVGDNVDWSVQWVGKVEYPGKDNDKYWK
jgi:hypothetical protein